MTDTKPILCVDFDGVIHSYTTRWFGEATIPDAPVPGALRWLWTATEWFDVQVFSSRSKSHAGREAMKKWMIERARDEFEANHPMRVEHRYPIKFPTDKPPAFLTIDDRALRFEGKWSDLDPATLRDFKPWNRM